MTDKIEKVMKVSGALDVDAAKQRKLPVNQDYFEALMKQGTGSSTPPVADAKIAEANPSKPTLMDQVRNTSNAVDPATKVTQSQLVQQTQEVIQKIDQVKETLSAPNVSVRPAYQGELKNKLTHIDENLKIALSKAGADFDATPTAQAGGVTNPIERYLGYLTSSQDQLYSLGAQLSTMDQAKEQLSPANMIAIQIKVGTIQTELEFFTGLLNKALDSTKTLMNVQV
jgi:hypothetical protein